MANLDNQGTVSINDLILSTLATTDALSKLLIEKGLITQGELMGKISAERATYQAMLAMVRDH